MKRLSQHLALTAGISLLLVAPVAAQDDHGDSPDDEAARRGAVVYATYCQACHGPTGQALASGPAFAAIEYDPDTARDVIVEGRDSDAADGAAMPAYSAMLDEAQIDDLIAYMATWDTGTTPPLPEPNIQLEVESVPDYFGDPQAGAVIYARFCYGCHGRDGAGRDTPKVPALDFSPQTIHLAAAGSPNVLMPGFGTDHGGPLNEQQLTDLETYMATWEQDHRDEPAGSGLDSLVVLVGAGMILLVGGVYIARGPRDKAEN